MSNCSVSSIAWLENDIFLMVYTPNSLEDEMGGSPPSSYYIITRRKQGPFLIQKLPELCSTIGGYKRTPAYQFIARLRDYKPHLKDALIVSSTASSDVGIITRSDQPLGSDDAAKQAVGKFAMTEVNDDTKKASLPLNESVEETSAIGLGIDLSSPENVLSPISGEALQESSTPLPNVFLLNNEGILSSWWFIYANPIRQKLPYHGLVSAGQSQAQAQAQSPQQPQPPAQQQQPSFGRTSFGGQSPLGAPPAFGKPSLPAFGSPSSLGGNRPAFGTPSFGTPSQPGASFGAPSQLGRGAPQFGKSGFGAMGSTSAFGQPSAPGKPIGTGGNTSGGGFGSFASSGGGFSGFAAAKPSGESPFSKPAIENPFGKPAQPSAFGSTDTTTAFRAQASNESKVGSGGFTLGSTFKGDGSAASDLPKPEGPSSFWSSGNLDDMLTSPNKPSTPMAPEGDMEPEPVGAQAEKPAAKEPVPSPFGALPKPDTSAPSGPAPNPFAQLAQPQKTPPEQPSKPAFSLFGNAPAEKPAPRPLSPPSEKTTIASTTPKQQAADAPSIVAEEAPLPPDPTSRAVYGPGDTSASSNVSKSSVEEVPLPPDPVTGAKTTPKEGEEAPSELPKEKKEEPPRSVLEEAPLPPDPGFSKHEATPEKGLGPVPDESDADESANEEAAESENEREEGDSDFADSGEEITHDVTEEESSKVSPESSFGGVSNKSPSAGLFSIISKSGKGQHPRQLFGEITKADTPRTLSPEDGRKIGLHRRSTSGGQGKTLASAKAAGIARKSQRPSHPRGISPGAARMHIQAQRQEEEEQLSLSDDDEDERLRGDLALPVEPVPTLDPFLPHQDYMGETSKPGIPGQIELLYRDINSMVDTLGINARSLASYVMYQQSEGGSNFEQWMEKLQSDNPTSVLEEDLRLSQIEKLDDAQGVLDGSLQGNRVDKIEEKLEHCRELLSKDIMTLRGQCAGMQKTLDAHTDTVAIRSAPLSAEQVNLQQDLRSSSTEIQTKLVDLEQAVSLLRARIAEIPRPDSTANGARQTKRPTMEQVASTIATMMTMAENKSSDIDVLEAQMRRMGMDSAPSNREGSPFTTPRKSPTKYPTTPGSVDGRVSAYHTPESARAVNLRSSVNGSTMGNRFRNVGEAGEMVTAEDTGRWKTKAQRKKYLVGSLKKAIYDKKSKVRGVDEF